MRPSKIWLTTETAYRSTILAGSRLAGSFPSGRRYVPPIAFICVTCDGCSRGLSASSLSLQLEMATGLCDLFDDAVCHCNHPIARPYLCKHIENGLIAPQYRSFH